MLLYLSKLVFGIRPLCFCFQLLNRYYQTQDIPSGLSAPPVLFSDVLKSWQQLYWACAAWFFISCHFFSRRLSSASVKAAGPQFVIFCGPLEPGEDKHLISSQGHRYESTEAVKGHAWKLIFMIYWDHFFHRLSHKACFQDNGIICLFQFTKACFFEMVDIFSKKSQLNKNCTSLVKISHDYFDERLMSKCTSVQLEALDVFLMLKTRSVWTQH